MLGQAISHVIKDFSVRQFVSLSHAEADITDRKNVDNAIRKYEAQVVFNCAAYTDVDGCERDPMLASVVNDEGARNVALACQDANILLCHISTDFVFDGETTRPYRESDSPNPASVYGATKLGGERHVAKVASKHLIIRTSWTFGPGGQNFITKVLERARLERQLDVVCDQTGSPTYTLDLARGILALVECGAHGLYHVANSGSCSRFELAKAALERAGFNKVPVHPIESATVKHKPSAIPVARRPAYSVLDSRAFTEKTGISLPHWNDALNEYLGTMAALQSPPRQ